MPLVREVVRIEERPLKESIARLAARRKSALENYRLYLRQQSSTKQNSRQEHFEIRQPSTSKAYFYNNNVDEETNMEIVQAEDEIIMELNLVTQNIPDCDVEDFVAERVNGSTIRKKRVTKTAAGDITSGAYGNVKKYAMDELKVKCVHCGAVRFAELKGRSVHSCCHSGQDLLTSTNGDAQHFSQRIRAYNYSFAFATFGAYLEEAQRGPLLIKIQGQVYHHAMTSLENVRDNAPRNGQIYIYDDVEAASRMRIDLDRPDLNIRLERLMREINPFAQKYKMLRDMTINGEEYVLDFVKYECDDKRYNRPTTSEVAIMIVSKDGSVPSVDLKVYPKQECNRESTILKQTSQHSDPMTFPILFPHDHFG
ncbi:hypothetical protein JTE90_023438 [Oedothorax gibbosus]|uniref:Helitron helicase-like domain-containing protein n=1 Tax=Oedothorax gibbosus TaxID=931172 RepID=A0AAV6U0A7_9ARAC|nr:hypothetical protein JTE90_023438 [Oedothorax gibbosus]